jgi:transcriptional regulator with XRE-family HTH domain
MGELRAQRGFTLEQLAQRTGFTKGYLSKIENSRKLPPIASLARIAQALETDVTGFFQTPTPVMAENASVVRVAERRPAVRGASAFGYDYVSLAHKKRDKRMEPFIFTFPSDIDKHVFFQHEGEEFIFILSGQVEFHVGVQKWMLDSGDSLYFDSRVPHRGRCLGKEAMALAVIYSEREPSPSVRKTPPAPRRKRSTGRAATRAKQARSR